MQRELKFRAWDEHNKKWAYETVESICSAVYFNDTSALDLPNTSCDDEILKKFCLFTGLKDKNGVEIYEGSIIKDNKDGAIGLVIYTPPSFSVKLKEKLNEEEYWILGAGKVYPDNYKLVDTEVIGNIYSNPELLEEAK